MSEATERSVRTELILQSTDGYKFTKYKGNPVLSEPNQTQFRDPKVNWDADAKLWRMAVAHPQVFQVTFYSSPDLKKWTETSRFASGLQGYQFECPGVEKVKAVGGPRDGQMLDMLLLSIKTGSPLGVSVVACAHSERIPEGN